MSTRRRSAAGSAFRGCVGVSRQAGGLDQLRHPRLLPLARHTVQHGEDPEVLGDGQLEVAGGRLQHDADRAAHVARQPSPRRRR